MLVFMRPENLKQPLSVLNQRLWRIIGAVCLAGCGVLAWFGPNVVRTSPTLIVQCLYWGFFLVLLLIAMYMVLLDIRYIRMIYAIGKRDIFLSTVGSEDFRKAIIAARREAEEADSDNG
jgi:hypothetical protein